jgi:hypothetical protein
LKSRSLLEAGAIEGSGKSALEAAAAAKAHLGGTDAESLLLIRHVLPITGR